MNERELLMLFAKEIVEYSLSDSTDQDGCTRFCCNFLCGGTYGGYSAEEVEHTKECVVTLAHNLIENN